MQIDNMKIKISREKFEQHFQIIEEDDFLTPTVDVDSLPTLDELMQEELPQWINTALPTEEEILAQPIRKKEYKELLKTMYPRQDTVSLYTGYLNAYFKGRRGKGYDLSFKLYKMLFGYPKPKGLKLQIINNKCINCGLEFISSRKCELCPKCKEKIKSKKHRNKIKEQKKQEKLEKLNEEIEMLEAKIKELRGE